MKQYIQGPRGRYRGGNGNARPQNPRECENGYDPDGAAYVVLGPASGTVQLATADTKFMAEPDGGALGEAVASAGDVNGDGFDDLIVGAWTDSESEAKAGAAYVVYMPVVGTVGLEQADVKLLGEAALDNAGWSVSGAGDVDADGLSDVLVGAQGNDAGGPAAGAAYLNLAPMTGTLELANADVKFMGEAAERFAGAGVSGAGDVDGDGLSDVLIGAATFGSDVDAYLVLGGAL